VGAGRGTVCVAWLSLHTENLHNAQHFTHDVKLCIPTYKCSTRPWKRSILIHGPHIIVMNNPPLKFVNPIDYRMTVGVEGEHRQIAEAVTATALYN